MPKHDFMTPKAISNRMKSVGLQRLRWYCQMCQKQCRDENGFKCHTASEGHLRQMKLFAENSGSVIDQFSRDFESGFLETLSHRHGTKRVLMNKVYQEYIADKHHIHMNSTMWTSLTGFCLYLGREGKAVVDETERGWFIQYIDRDPKVLARQQAREQRQQAELDDQERTNLLISAQVEAANRMKTTHDESHDNGADEPESGDYDSNKESKNVEISLKLGDTRKRKLRHAVTDGFNSEEESLNDVQDYGAHSDFVSKSNLTTSSSNSGRFRETSNPSSSSTSAGINQLSLLMIEEENRKKIKIQKDDRESRRDYWLHPGIIVKIMNKTLGDGRFYKQKGEVVRVVDKYVGEVKVDGAIIRIDQEHLETVIPQVGQVVLIVNGRARSLPATLLAINEDNFNCDLQVKPIRDVNGPNYFYSDMVLRAVEYEDVCKLA